MIYLVVNIVISQSLKYQRVSYWWIYRIYQSWWPTMRCMDLLIVEHLNPVLGNCTTNLLSVYSILPIHFHYQSHRTIKENVKWFFIQAYEVTRDLKWSLNIPNITSYPMPSTKKCLVGYHSNPFLAKHLRLIFTADSTLDINTPPGNTKNAFHTYPEVMSYQSPPQHA